MDTINSLDYDVLLQQSSKQFSALQDCESIAIKFRYANEATATGIVSLVTSLTQCNSKLRKLAIENFIVNDKKPMALPQEFNVQLIKCIEKSASSLEKIRLDLPICTKVVSHHKNNCNNKNNNKYF